MTIGFEHVIYSVDEGNIVEVCAVLNGTLENTLEVFVNSSSGSTTGTLCVLWCSYKVIINVVMLPIRTKYIAIHIHPYTLRQNT